jgi:transcriptional regulator with PAS, ATPase and Fis domain
MLCRYAWPGNVRQLISTVERIAAKAGGGRMITTDHVRREMDTEQEPVLMPGAAERLPLLREGETIEEHLCREVLAIYDLERAWLGIHSAVASRLGINRNTLTDWLARARRHIQSKSQNSSRFQLNTRKTIKS